MMISIKSIKKVYIFMIVGIVFITIYLLIFPFKSKIEESTYRALPRPIGSEPLMITSAGQSTDIYIVKDIANKLRIDNYFMPIITSDESPEVNSVVMVIGYSEVGIRLNDMVFDQEKERVVNLLEDLSDKDIPIVSLYLRGSQMLSDENKALLSIVIDYSDYMIVTEDHGDRSYFESLASNAGIPLTIVDNVNEVSEPFVSVFR